MINFMMDFCNSTMWPIVSIVRNVVNLIKFGIPVILIIFGMLDLGKAVMAGKEDEMKKAQSTLIKRVIYAVLVFLVITIVQFVMSIVSDAGVGEGASDTNTNNWYYCVFKKDKSGFYEGTTNDDGNN